MFDNIFDNLNEVFNGGDKMRPKLYLAGPEVFLPNAVENAEIQRQLCRKYGFTPLHPMDNNSGIDFNGGMDTAMKIYRGDIQQIQQCHFVVANCNSFRGVCMDDGTAYELGYGNALGKPSYGYIRDLRGLVERTLAGYQCKPFEGGVYVDRDGYIVVDDFGTSINLMMQCGMMFGGGVLVEGDFEACLKVMRADIDSGRFICKVNGQDISFVLKPDPDLPKVVLPEFTF
ncbi:MAG: nucleoside 2-deoxyribosyltransferase [Candidatus Spechtbacteria bacterium]|nr:nucleoside 2-deoxyribosyltransferase [Candidatus Spechtbacteria bacterium]